MAEPLSEIEKTLLKIAASEERIERVEARIERLLEGGRPTKIHEEFLDTLRDSLSLLKAHLGILSTPLASYRCYLMTDGRIRGVQVYDCRDDAEAFMEASGLLESKCDWHHIEIGKDVGVSVVFRNRLGGRNYRPWLSRSLQFSCR